MRFRSHLAAVCAALLTAVCVVFGATPAMAVDASGNASLAGPAGHGTGGYYIDYTNNTVAINVTPSSLEESKCLTIYLDAARTPGVLEPGGSNTHLDPWIARTCRNGTGRSSGTQYMGSTYGIDLVRPLHTLAVCYGPNNVLGTCIRYAGTQAHLEAMNHSLFSGMPCGQGYIVYTSGTVGTYDTGHPTRCDL